VLTEFAIEGVRNLQPMTVVPSPGVNLIVGPNGSGKTSILEGIAILALGRSFRATKLAPVCRTGVRKFLVTGQLCSGAFGDDRVGVVWDGVRRSRLNLEWVDSHASVVERFPLVIMHADLHEQVLHFPSERRRVLDWGAFYSQPEFRGVWKRWRRAHEQRNAWLRQVSQGSAPLVEVVERFEAEIAENGNQVSALRGSFVDRLRDQLRSGLLGEFMEEQGITVGLEFRRGWSAELDLGSALAKSRRSDAERGFGQIGPQRADLEIRLNGRALREASRGEQKRLVVGLLMGQGQALRDEPMDGGEALAGGQKLAPVFLLDDPVAELDGDGSASLIRVLHGLGWQIFLTTTDVGWARKTCEEYAEVKLFHVEHGEVKEG
jgi:DNA replication and repair protein RecF